MANMSTLFRKGYLLAGVIMAANMFVVNEMKAMKEENNNIVKKEEEINIEKKEEEINKLKQKIEDLKKQKQNIKYSDEKIKEMEQQLEEMNKRRESGVQNILDKVLSWENTINLIGGAAFSVANNYFKWWDYNPGKYRKLGCFGWRSGRLINIFQIDINLNLGRGILWLIPGTYNFIKASTAEEEGMDELYLQPLHFSYLVADSVSSKFFNDSILPFRIALIFFFLLQGFVSAPLAIHISNFSISISLDSMLWAGIGKFLDKTEEKKEGNKNEDILNISQENQQN